MRKNSRMNNEIYFHRELLCYSREMRYLELITITGKDGCELYKEREPKF